MSRHINAKSIKKFLKDVKKLEDVYDRWEFKKRNTTFEWTLMSKGDEEVLKFHPAYEYRRVKKGESVPTALQLINVPNGSMLEGNIKDEVVPEPERLVNIKRSDYKPEYGEVYYHPCLDGSSSFVDSTEWTGHLFDKKLLAMGLYCSTYGEAKSYAKELFGELMEEEDA